ncbi:MAG: hypothetical protein P9L94_14195 [Candidatus Hinthialibacter antarcticus]|nr:hypothetical protein [Candidatus Hinthialibacter antarcticus]
MPIKPNSKTILSTYSLDELLSLVKDKAAIEAEAKLQEVRTALAALTGMEAPKKRGPKPGAKRGPKPGAKRGPKPGKKTGRGPGRPRLSKPGRKPGSAKKPLKGYLLEVLSKDAMKIEEIMAALKTAGYKSKSKDPRRVLYLELKKQVSSGAVKKSGRGLYALK